jgi:branched-chain amino acid transport system permease protein
MSELISAIFLGGMYATVSLGLTLVFGVMRLVNLAHGELLVGGGYLAFFFSEHLNLDPFVSLLLVIPAVMAIGYVLQRGLLNPLLAHGQEPPLVATFGLSLIAQTLFLIAFTSNPQSLNASYGVTGIDVLGTTVRTIIVIALGVGVVLVLATHFGIARLRFGVALRAAAEDPEAATSLGINVKHIYALTFAIGAALSAFGGVLIGVSYSLTPTTGLSWLLLAFTVIVLGGMGSIIGTLVGGFAIALAQQYGALAFGPQYETLIVFSMLVIVLVVRPQGFFGKSLA